jgi:hypothetical protein
MPLPLWSAFSFKSLAPGEARENAVLGHVIFTMLARQQPMQPLSFLPHRQEESVNLRPLLFWRLAVAGAGDQPPSANIRGKF